MTTVNWDAEVLEGITKRYEKDHANTQDQDAAIHDGVLCALKATMWSMRLTNPKHDDVLQSWITKHVGQDNSAQQVCLQYVRFVPSLQLFFRSAYT